MSVRTKVGLGFNNYIGENELGWDDSAFSVFTTNSEEVEGRPHFNRFAKTDSMKAVPPPLSGDYTPLSDHTNLDESQISYGTKSSTSGDSNSMSDDFVSCDNSDKSSEVNSNEFASSNSSVKTSEPKSNDSTSCASTSSISTSKSEAEIESYAGTHIHEPIIVQDLPSFSCNSSDKNENTSRTSCNKNGYFNKKASHFRKNNSSTSKSYFVCGTYLHLIKDCNYYETQYANDFDGMGYPQREPIWDNATRVTQSNHFVLQTVLHRYGKVSILAARPNQVSTGRPKPVSTGRLKPVSTSRPKPVPTDKPKVPEPVPTGRQNRPFLFPIGRRYSPSENPYSDAEDEGIFDSDCSRSRITRKGTIRTPTLDFENVYYVKELQHFNLFSISQICDKKNRVLFTDTDCLVLSKDFMLPDEIPTGSITIPSGGTMISPGNGIPIPIGSPTDSFFDNEPATRFPSPSGPLCRHNKPFGCHVTILNITDHLGKFDGKADEGYIVGYSASNKAYRVYNVHNKRVEETMNLRPIKRNQANQIQSESKPKDTFSDEVMILPHEFWRRNFFQQELARLKDQVKRATSDEKDAEELQQKARTKTVPSGSIPIPTGSIKIPSGGTTISPSNVPF
ncbi:hypothetical protein Tco_1459168 [Tanacetum coccineum]